MSAPVGYVQLSSGFWTKSSDGSGPYALNSSGEMVLVGTGNVFTTLPNGGVGLVTPSGTISLARQLGTPHEGLIAGVPYQQISVDAGSDVDHGQLIWTPNCTLGANLSSPDNDLAGARMANYNADPEVFKTEITGAFGMGSIMLLDAPLTMLHFAIAGGSSYTVAAGNVLTGTQMVVMLFSPALNIMAADIRFGTATKGAGSNFRYRSITVTTFSGT